MNVLPYLLDHPKFRRYKRALGAPDALEYLVRLWAHCQEDQRGEDWGKVDPATVEEIAKWEGEPGKLFAALKLPYDSKPGWIQVTKQKQVIIVGWREHNARLVVNWELGNRAKKPRANNATPTPKPRLNQGSTHATPTPKPFEMSTDEMNRGEHKETLAPSVPDHPVLPQFQEPSLQEVLTYADMHGVQVDCAKKFFWDRKGAGWIERGQPIVDWQAKLQAYSVSWRGQEYLQNAGVKADGPFAGMTIEDLEARLQGEQDPEKRRALRDELKKRRGGGA